MNRLWEMTENTPTQAQSEMLPIFHLQVLQTLSGILNVCSFPACSGNNDICSKVCNILRELLLPLVPVRQRCEQTLTWKLALQTMGFNEFGALL